VRLLSVFGGWQYGFVAADCAGAVLFCQFGALPCNCSVVFFCVG